MASVLLHSHQINIYTIVILCSRVGGGIHYLCAVAIFDMFVATVIKDSHFSSVSLRTHIFPMIGILLLHDNLRMAKNFYCSKESTN